MNLKVALVVLKQELISAKSFVLIILFATLFVSTSIIAINLPSFVSFLFNSYPILTKLNILWLIFVGSFSAISRLDVVLVLVMGILFGINMTLLINKYSALKKRGNLKIMFGTGIISVFAAGCASCGLSFTSIIGISAVIAVLPFGGVELYLLAILVLIISIYFNLKQIIKVCKLA